MSTLETAIVFAILLTILTFFVTAPETIASESFYDCKYGFEEYDFQNKDTKLLNEKKIGSAISYDASPEKLCTYLMSMTRRWGWRLSSTMWVTASTKGAFRSPP